MTHFFWSILLVVSDFVYTFSSSPHCSSLLFLHHFLRGQYPSIYFYVFWKNLQNYFSMHKFIYHLFVCLSLSRYRPLHGSLYLSIPLPHSVLLSFLPVSFPPPTISTYFTTFLFSSINFIKIVFFSYINIIEILYIFYIRVGLNTPLMPCYWVISLFFLLQDFSLTLPS